MGKSEGSKSKAGTVVWAKYATYPFWPSRIVSLSDVKKDVRSLLPTPPPPNHELVWFFGSNNCAYVPRSNITDYAEGYEEKANNKKERTKKGFLKALKEADKWEKDGGKESKKSKRKKSDSEDDSESSSESSEESGDEEDKKEEKSKRKKKKKERKRKSDDKGKKSDDEDSSKRKKQDSDKEEKTPKKRRISENGTKKPKVESPETPTDKASDLDSSYTNDDGKEALYVSPKSGDNKKMTHESIAHGVSTLQRHPVAKYLRYSITQQPVDGTAVATATFSDLRHNVYEVHSCIATANFLLDVTCLAAALSVINEGESAITQDFHANVLAPIPPGSEITIKSRVVASKMPGVLYCSGEIYLSNKLMVTGSVTKSTLEQTLPVRTKSSSSSTEKETGKDKEE